MTETIIDNDLHELVWSLWSELGVPGWQRHHDGIAADPEALIVFSTALPNLDSRLREEIAGWSIACDRFLSAIRLGNLAKAQDEHVAESFYEFSLGLRDVAGLNWPTGDAKRVAPLRVRPRPIQREHFSRPSLISLRLRAIFGVGARAEVLRTLIAYPDIALSAPEVAMHIFFARRNVANVLDALELAGIVGSMNDRRSVRYVLTQSLADVIGQTPTAYPYWPDLFRILLDLRALLANQKTTSLLRAVQAQRFLETHAFTIARNNLPPAPRIAPGYEVWSQLESWAVNVTRSIAGNEGDVLKTPRFRPTFVRVKQPASRN